MSHEIGRQSLRPAIRVSVCLYKSDASGAQSELHKDQRGDSWEKRKKAKVQEGNAPIKILIKTSLFTQSSVTNGFLSLPATVSLPTQPESL